MSRLGPLTAGLALAVSWAAAAGSNGLLGGGSGAAIGAAIGGTSGAVVANQDTEHRAPVTSRSRCEPAASGVRYGRVRTP
jgi:hypothetical protein